jgi:hypothetical protein
MTEYADMDENDEMKKKAKDIVIKPNIRPMSF